LLAPPADPALPCVDFAEAAREAVAFLRAQSGLAMWLVACVNRGEGTEDPAHGVVLAREGAVPGWPPDAWTVFPWEASLVARLAAGAGPRLVPDLAAAPAYRGAPPGRSARIAACVAAPLCRADGSVFGALCGFDPRTRPLRELAPVEPAAQLLARMLSLVLAKDEAAAAADRRAERALADATTDPLTGLHNRRAWDRFLASEEQRCRRFGHPAVVYAIDLDDLKRVNDRDGHLAGDALLRRAAIALREAAREHDVVARTGGDEFCVLAAHIDAPHAEILGARLEGALSAVGIRASMGFAARDPRRGLGAAAARADDAMYRVKHDRRRTRG
jgi:diguanylate cyclase (GGDEF)-like protein